MIDDYFKEYYYLSDFERGKGLKQNLNITTQVLGSLTRVMQIHNRGNSSYSYFEEDSKYFRSKENSAKEEINYSTFRINTFLDEFYALK